MGMKLTVKKKPATKARKGINPFTRRRNDVQGEAASKAVKVPFEDPERQDLIFRRGFTLVRNDYRSLDRPLQSGRSSLLREPLPFPSLDS